MKRVLINSLFYLSMCSFIFMTGCSTPIKQAGKEHATSIAKWNELARYAESKFKDYPIAITAQLALLNSETGYAYQLKNIQLSKKENSYNINLLAPDFEHKYICNPICYQLLEYVENSPTHGSTLLNEYFALHEFELFSFYGELFKMNDRLERLTSINTSQLNNYFHYLHYEKRRFQTLDSFAKYLSENLTEEKYQAFLDDPNAKTIRQKASQVSSLFKQPPEANSTWSYPSENTTPEMQLWQHLNDIEKNNWTQFPESNDWQLSDFKPKHFTKTSSGNHVHGAWLMAKNIDVQPNNYVCSYSDNKFGRVSKMSDSNIQVELIGQAKLLQDGILYDLEEGALFNGANQAITFLPLQGSQSFSRLNIAMCQPE